MGEHNPLYWVHRNRSGRRPVRTVTAAAVVQSLVNDFESRSVGPAIEMAVRLAPLVDEAFRRHARVAAVRGRTLVIHVDDSALVSALSRRWLMPLRAALGRGRGGPVVRDIVFQYGSDGVRLDRVSPR